MQSHTGCICLTFLQCVFSCVSSKCLPEMKHSHTGCICLIWLSCFSCSLNPWDPCSCYNSLNFDQLPPFALWLPLAMGWLILRQIRLFEFYFRKKVKVQLHVQVQHCTMSPLSTRSCLKSNKVRPISNCWFCRLIYKKICLNVFESKQRREKLVFVIL